jgi:hypothetical protein
MDSIGSSRLKDCPDALATRLNATKEVAMVAASVFMFALTYSEQANR